MEKIENIYINKVDNELFDLIWLDLSVEEKAYLIIKAVNRKLTVDGLLMKTLNKVNMLD